MLFNTKTLIAAKNDLFIETITGTGKFDLSLWKMQESFK